MSEKSIVGRPLVLETGQKRLRGTAGLGLLLTGILAVSVLVAGRLSLAPGAQGGSSGSIVVSSPRVVVLKSKRCLHLFDGDRLVRTYAVDLGTSPVGNKRRFDDARTPEGRFRVVTRNSNSPYHRFLGIDYPNEDAVSFGLAHGLVSQGEAVSIRAALAEGRCPDWGTALGGGIGIHGKRKGIDWTGGCVAVEDAQIEELYAVLRLGDPVEILP
jgi:murein L,D-transpeptidase YafK